MTIFENVRDDIYINKLRKSLSLRKTVAYLYTLGGIIFIGFAAYYGVAIYNEMMTYVGHLDADSTRALTPSDLAAMNAKSNFYFGISIGAALVSGLYFGASLLVSAAVLHFGGRKEKMLLHYYAQATRTDT